MYAHYTATVTNNSVLFLLPAHPVVNPIYPSPVGPLIIIMGRQRQGDRDVVRYSCYIRRPWPGDGGGRSAAVQVSSFYVHFARACRRSFRDRELIFGVFLNLSSSIVPHYDVLNSALDQQNTLSKLCPTSRRTVTNFELFLHFFHSGICLKMCAKFALFVMKNKI